MRNHLSDEDASLAVQLYLSNNEDVEAIITELFKLQEKYTLARQRATIGAVADKFEVCDITMGNILKRRGIPRHKCSARVFVSKNTRRSFKQEAVI